MAGFTALFLSSRMGSTRPNVAQGYELEVIAMVVLGGVSTSGGKGTIAGPLLAILIIGFLDYGLGLVNIQAEDLLIVVGLLLILSVLVLNVGFGTRKRKPAPLTRGEKDSQQEEI
jgi:rhamnose transport system permease protein